MWGTSRLIGGPPHSAQGTDSSTFDASEGLYLVQSYLKTTSGLNSFTLTQGQMSGELKRWSPQFTRKPMEKHFLDAALEQVQKRRRAKRLSLNRTAQPRGGLLAPEPAPQVQKGTPHSGPLVPAVQKGKKDIPSAQGAHTKVQVRRLPG